MPRRPVDSTRSCELPAGRKRPVQGPRAQCRLACPVPAFPVLRPCRVLLRHPRSPWRGPVRESLSVGHIAVERPLPGRRARVWRPFSLHTGDCRTRAEPVFPSGQTRGGGTGGGRVSGPVSYTHLTLPTKRIV